MGHVVTGLIASAAVLSPLSREHALHPPVQIGQGLAVLPLRDRDIDSIITTPQSGHPPGFLHLSEQLLAFLRLASHFGPLVYFETDYFGGVGSQGAVAFRDGAVVYGPEAQSIGPINDALRHLGVRVVAPAFDEFETVGLHRHRHTEDWIDDGPVATS